VLCLWTIENAIEHSVEASLIALPQDSVVKGCWDCVTDGPDSSEIFGQVSNECVFVSSGLASSASCCSGNGDVSDHVQSGGKVSLRSFGSCVSDKWIAAASLGSGMLLLRS
jgi:hypothetical protein